MSEADPSARRTWDGLEIAADRPTGASVCVRRTSPAGERQVLLLHRSSKGPRYDGDWAWTCPAGCRQPGEAVYPAALRELAEEAGLAALHPWAVDLSGAWATFAVDIEADRPVTLVDPEHDRFEWHSPAVARGRVRPEFVGAQQYRAAMEPTIDVRFRPTGIAPDRGTGAWAADLDGERAVELSMSEPVGTGEPGEPGEPGTVCLEVALGESARVGDGILTRVVWEFCRDVLRPEHGDATQVVVQAPLPSAGLPEALVRCGFVESGQHYLLDVRHWLG